MHRFDGAMFLFCISAKLVVILASSFHLPDPKHGAYSQYLFALQLYIVMSWQRHQCDYSSIKILLIKLYVMFVWHLMLN